MKGSIQEYPCSCHAGGTCFIVRHPDLPFPVSYGTLESATEALNELEHMAHILNVVVGDWSKDGHSQSENYTIESNLSAAKVQEACAKGEGILGFKLKNICADYEESSLPDDFVAALKTHGFKFDNFDHCWEENSAGEYKENPDRYRACSETFVELWAFIVKLGNPKFSHKLVKGKNINIGGYGLFTS